MTHEILHSLSSVQDLVLDWLDAAGARTVVEIGAEAGLFTDDLAAWAGARGGSAICVDPFPTDALRAVVARHPSARLVEARSPGALAAIPPADAYVVDGDHNYATVRAELAAIARIAAAAGRHVLVVLHDVGWPCARRDFYYDPASLAPGDVHPHGRAHFIAPGTAGPVPHGFGSDGTYDLALEEGGPRNGVLTAVEDFVAAGDGWVHARVPLVFGVGALWRRDAPWAAALEARVRPWREHPVLARVEENRVRNFVATAELFAQAEALRGRAVAAEARIAAAEAQAAAQAARAVRLEARLAHVEGTLAWRLAVRARDLRNRLVPEGTRTRRALGAGIAAVRNVVRRPGERD